MTIEVDELSDTQEKEEENKKSGGPGKFQNPNNCTYCFILNDL